MRSLLVALSVATAARFAAAVPIEVVDGNNMPIVSATIDGVPCSLIVDTGASHTTLDVGFVTNNIPNARLQDVMLVGSTNVKTPPKFLSAKTLKVGEITFQISGVMTFDLSHLPTAVRRPVNGVLGMDYISRVPCIISLGRGELIWRPSKTERKGFKTVPSRTRGNSLEVMAKLPSGKTLALLMDSGSSLTLIDHTLWPMEDSTVELSAASVNGTKAESNTLGKREKIFFGNDFSIEIKPILTKQKDLNQIGADFLRRVDLLIDGQTISLRPQPTGTVPTADRRWSAAELRLYESAIQAANKKSAVKFR